MSTYILSRFGVLYPRKNLNTTNYQKLLKNLTIKVLKKIPGKRNQILNIKNYRVDKNYVYLPRFFAINKELNLINKINGKELKLNNVSNLNIINLDNINNLIQINYNFKGFMLDYQEIIIKYLLDNIYSLNSIIKGSSCSVLKLETGYGKTYVAMNLISLLKLRTLIIIPNTIILEQWYEALVKLFPDEKIGKYYGKEKNIQNITLGIINSCCSKEFYTSNKKDAEKLTVGKFYSNFDFIIFDEVHKYTGAKQRIVFDNSQSLCMLGLSASIDKKQLPLLPYITSRIGNVIDCNADIPNLHLENVVFTSEVRILEYRGSHKYTQPVLNDDGIMQYMGSARRVSSDPKRNTFIIENLLKILDHNIFILTIFREHVSTLYSLLTNILPNIELDAPELDDNEIKEIKKNKINKSDITNIMGGSTLSDIEEAKNSKIIISTYKYTGTGVSIDNMTALVIAAPIKNEILQVAGRIFRKNKKYDDIERIILDICDVRSPLKNQVYTRIKEYKRRKCRIIREKAK